MKKLLAILVVSAATLFSAALRADDYPSRPIAIVAVFGPGSASDTICRHPYLGSLLSSCCATRMMSSLR